MGRLITFDERGTGISDPVPLGMPRTLEEAMDDALAILDHAASRQAVLIGIGSGAPIAFVLAASHPTRFDRLVVVNGFARFARAPDHPWGMPDYAEEHVLEEIEAGWGKGGAEWAMQVSNLRPLPCER
jgi:pimeloyl-ACP methyl ester carboxylesterase